MLIDERLDQRGMGVWKWQLRNRGRWKGNRLWRRHKWSRRRNTRKETKQNPLFVFLPQRWRTKQKRRQRVQWSLNQDHNRYPSETNEWLLRQKWYVQLDQHREHDSQTPGTALHQENREHLWPRTTRTKKHRFLLINWGWTRRQRQHSRSIRITSIDRRD